MCHQTIIDYKMNIINMSHDFFKIVPICHDLRPFKMDDVHFFLHHLLLLLPKLIHMWPIFFSYNDSKSIIHFLKP
jgi:glycerol-3-phosphate acyltransferase PlsY